MKISQRQINTICAALLSFADGNPESPSRDRQLRSEYPEQFGSTNPLSNSEIADLVEYLENA